MRFLVALLLGAVMLAPALSAQSFTVAAAPHAATYMRGIPSHFTFSVSAGTNFTASVYLQASAPNGPPGVSTSVTPDVVNAPFPTGGTLNVTVPTYSESGTYPIVIKAYNGSVASFDTVMLTVTAPANNGWHIYTKYNTPMLANKTSAIDVDRNGTLWVGQYTGTYSFDGVAWTHHPPASELRTYVTSIAVDSANIVWEVDNQTVRYYKDSTWASVTMQDAFTIRSMAAASSGQIWVTDGNALKQYDSGQWKTYTAQNSPLKALGGGGWGSLIVEPPGTLWVGGAKSADRYDGAFWTNIPSGTFAADKPSATFGLVAAYDPYERSVWMIHEGGVTQLSGTQGTFYPASPDYLVFPGPAPIGIAFGPDGSRWVWHSFRGGGGVTRYKNDGAWHYTHYNSPLTDTNIVMVKVTPQNVVWIATDDNGIAKLDGNLDPGAVMAVNEPRAATGEAGMAVRCSPNPMAAAGTLRLVTPRRGPVQIDLYDALGAPVLHAFDGQLDAGEHTLSLDVSGLPNGAYYLRAAAASTSATSTVIVAR